jgi:hypothetical protein
MPIDEHITNSFKVSFFSPQDAQDLDAGYCLIAFSSEVKNMLQLLFKEWYVAEDRESSPMIRAPSIHQPGGAVKCGTHMVV